MTLFTRSNLNRTVFGGIIGFGLLVQASNAQAADPKMCEQVVQSLKNEWNAVGYTTPSKPTAMRVVGKLGHENTAGQIISMQRQMAEADADCKAGKQDEALQKVASIHDLLDAHGISEETANAAMIPTK